jgi:hypothetical protein
VRRIQIHAFHWKDIHRLKDNSSADRVLEDPQKDRIKVIALLHALMLVERDTAAVMIDVKGRQLWDYGSSHVAPQQLLITVLWQCQPHIGIIVDKPEPEPLAHEINRRVAA